MHPGNLSPARMEGEAARARIKRSRLRAKVSHAARKRSAFLHLTRAIKKNTTSLLSHIHA